MNALIGTALVALAPAVLRAQAERPTFRYLTIADGLSQNAVSAITQDQRGFMWFGTKDGLNRYDGYSFVVYRHDPADSATVSGSEITAIFEDSRHELWVGTRHGGLSRFNRARETFQRYPHGPSAPITAIAEDADGQIWIGTDGAGVFRLSREAAAPGHAAFTHFTHDPADPGSLSNDRVFALLADRRGTLWVGTDQGLNRLDRPAGQAAAFLRYDANAASSPALIDHRVSALYEDAAGQLWIGSLPGISVFDATRQSIAHYYHRYRTYRYGWGEPIAMLEDRAGRIWISTHAELMRFEPGTRSFSYFRHDPLAQQGINSNVPTALFRDRSGVMWIGTNGFGINIHDPKADRFHTVRRPDDRPHRLSGFSVYTLFEDGAGRVWVDAGLLYRWDRATGSFTSFETSSERPDDFGNTGVWSIIEDPPGFLWAGTYQGLYHYHIATGQYRQFKHDPRDAGGLPEQVVYDVFKDRTGAIWVVTENHIARLTDPARGRFRSYRYNERPSTGQWAFPSTWQDADGIFWLGSRQGLVRFDADAGTFRYFRHDPARPASLSHDVVRSILADPREPQRVLWIGTAGGGLNRFDIHTETFSALTEADGLPNNVVYGVLADSDDRLWLSTNKGIARFDPRTGRFRNFDVNDGLQSNEFNSGAYFRSRSGELFFGGIYGFNHFHPADVEENRHVPPVVITGFKRLNRYETVRDSASVLKSAISETSELRLSYHDDVITFEFAALDYSAPSKNLYAYRLAGFNNEWIESGSVRSATYANLPPGRYSFQVRGSNNDGIWNQNGASIAVIITPPWWRTWWAYALYALAVVCALYGLWRHDMRRIRLEHHLALERVEKEQMRELDRARSRFFANVSHEFRTPLTLTLGPLDDVLAGRHGSLSDAMREQVDLARRSAARVLDLIDQILGLARLEAGSTTLRARRLDVGAFVESLAMTFRPFAERKALAFQVQAPAELVDVYADPDHLERILSNLLSNAFKFTPGGGNMRVSIEADVATVCIAVRDSGRGIAAAELSRIFDRFHRAHESSAGYLPGTGIGLALAKELVELHGGSIEVASEEGFGSTFTVRLLRGRAHLKPEQVVGDDTADAWKQAATPAPSIATSHDEAALTVTGEEDITTVLVIEDNADVRAYVRRHLAPRYRVLEAADGETGLALTRRSLPDLVLSDVMMPGLDGHALCRAIKTDPETDFIPIILLTARAAPEDRVAGLQERADDYLTKPFDVNELLARVENLIASRKLLRERFAGAPGLSLHPTAIDVVPADEKFLEQVRVAIEANLGDEDFSVEQLARQVAHSRSHLHRRLRALVNESPSDLIRRMRLERAAQLLAAGSGSVAGIAYSVGFKSVAHFSNSFNEHIGVRPSAYRVTLADQEVARPGAV